MSTGEDTRKTDSLIGEAVGEYRIEQRLGSGGMGIVYRAVHSVIGKEVAIKVLRAEGDAEHTQRLLAEARTVSTLRHRGIADIFGFGTLGDGRPYIVMELLQGRPLDVVLRDRGTMPPEEALWVLEEALGPMAAAHARGVVHRDIKPSNFFISEEADGSRYLKILDFGLAKSRSGENLTAVGSVLGTPDYMSPEQAQARQVGPAADIYSLGATAFELLTGGPVFTGNAPMEIMVQQVHNEAPRVSSKVRAIPAEIDDLIAQMLEKDPAKRPASASELKARVSKLRKKFARETTRELAAPVEAAAVPPPAPSQLQAPMDAAAPVARAAEAESNQPMTFAPAPGLPAEPTSKRAPTLPPEPTSKRNAGLGPEPTSKRAPALPPEPTSKRNAGLGPEPTSKRSPALLPEPTSKRNAGLSPEPTLKRTPSDRTRPSSPPSPVGADRKSGGTASHGARPHAPASAPSKKSGALKWVFAAVGLLALVGIGGVLLLPRGEAIPTTPPEPVKLDVVQRPVRDKPTVVAAVTDPVVPVGVDAGVPIVGVEPVQVVPEPDPEKATKIAQKRKPPPDRSLEARIKKDEALLKTRARGGEVDLVAAGFLRAFKDELKNNPASRGAVTKKLAEWERKFLR